LQFLSRAAALERIGGLLQEHDVSIISVLDLMEEMPASITLLDFRKMLGKARPLQQQEEQDAAVSRRYRVKQMGV